MDSDSQEPLASIVLLYLCIHLVTTPSMLNLYGFTSNKAHVFHVSVSQRNIKLYTNSDTRCKARRIYTVSFIVVVSVYVTLHGE